MEQRLTIIPARGGSKGINKKNLQVINGKSLVERAVISALKIQNNLIIVSSDDDQILENIEKYNVNSFKRGRDSSSDLASSESVVTEILENLSEFSGLVTLLQPTSPFVDVYSWEKALNYLENNQHIHSMFSAVDKNEFIWELKESWIPVNHDRKNRLPRQMKRRNAVETGSFYIFRTEQFKEEGIRFCGVTEPAYTELWSDFDIDNQEDLDFCREISKIIDFPPYTV
jgi:CMP-N-acetylneuraminic acid synthetase